MGIYEIIMGAVSILYILNPRKIVQNYAMKNITNYLILLAFFISCTGSQYKGPVSDHFDGTYFYNPDGSGVDKKISDLIKWRMTGDRKQWPEWVDIEQQKVAQARVPKNKAATTFINHATVLLQIDGKNILIDPIWSERASPFTWIGPKRVKLPGVKIEDIPPIDIILISHNHYDHMDIETLKFFNKRDKPQVVVGLGSSEYLDEISNIKELDWYQSVKLGSVELVFTPSMHWSKRWLFDRNKCLWGAFVILSNGKKIYFGGDTGYGNHFKEAHKRWGDFDFAFLPIGAYEPRWFMKQQHINPMEALRAHRDLKSKQSLGIHFGTFQLTDEGIDDPEKDLRTEMKKQGTPFSEFIVPKNGESFNIY
jgi:L-ascorbate metabolism protein UlaG (beta-lactamase superfamily)